MRLPKYIWGFLVAMLCVCNVSYAATVKLSGIIQYTTSDTVKVSYNDSRLAYYPKEFFAVVDKKGNFSIAFQIPAGEYIQAEVKYGNHLTELMLYDGDSLTLFADDKRFDSSIRYEGRGAAIQNFVARHTVEKGRMNLYAQRLKTQIEKEPGAFLKAIEKEKNDELAFLDKNSAQLPQPFVKFWKAYFQYYNYFFIQQYPQVHQMMKLRRYTDTIPEENFIVLKEMPNAFDDNMMQVPSYLLYLSGVFEVRLKAAGYCFPITDSSKARRFLDSVNILGYKQLPDKSSEYFIAQALYPRIKSQEIERTRTQFATFKKRWKDSEYTLLLSKQIATAERLLPGQPAPDLDIITSAGERKKLSDLKGKVVYLSFWASFCKQCVGEIRQQKKVVEVLKNKPAEFVYVCIDEDTTTAVKMINHFKIEGNFVWTTGGWYAKEVGLYGVQGLPAYFLIDREGNFAVQNPPTPQQTTELIVAISRLY